MDSNGWETVNIKVSRCNPAYGVLLALEASGFSIDGSVVFTDSKFTEMSLDGVSYKNSATIARFIISNSNKACDLIGRDIVEQTEIDCWVTTVEQHLNCGVFEDVIIAAEEKLNTDPYLCLSRLTLADIVFWAVLTEDDKVRKREPFSTFFQKILNHPSFAFAHDIFKKFKLQNIEMSEKSKSKSKITELARNQVKKENLVNKKTKDQGRFIDLPGAEKGKVVVRFPPEASGYLHIGHAKAVLLNQYYQQTFEGKLIMRFDDTNPAKENAYFEQVILDDLKMLGVKPDYWSHTSDYFELMMKMCERLLQENKAYVDDTDSETMKKEREERKESRCRSNAVDQNLELWTEMKKATKHGQQCCVRIKIDMKNNNGAMRDPTIYRCKVESHIRTGNKYKVYPTYDFACPIVDSVEGVTHALRTTEYIDRDEQYYFICDVLGLRKPYIWSYARLNMMNAVMSKRKLLWLVDEHHVEGWDDPRLPTVRGIVRRGLTVEGLKQFILAQGGSRAVVMMEWDKIWSFNKKVIDPIAPRYTALLAEKNPVQVTIIDNIIEESKEVSLHPKNIQNGTKTVWYSRKLMIEEVDACEMNVGDTVTFINWGNMKICNIMKDGNRITEIKAKLDLDNKDYKKTFKVTWIANAHENSSIPIKVVEYSHIISKAIVAKDENWKDFVNYKSVKYIDMIGESAMKKINKGDIIQLQRKGYYICDSVYSAKSEYSGIEMPIVLISIPDGSNKSGVVHETEVQSSIKKLAAENERIGSNGAITVQDFEKIEEGSCQMTLMSEQVKESVFNDDLYRSIDQQRDLVRSLKSIDPTSQETKSAILKLLDLKKQWEQKTGLNL